MNNTPQTKSSAEVIIHSIFQDGSDLGEIIECVKAFIDGDPGCHKSEDEILGFMRNSVENKTRHGVYETKTGGRVHVVGNDEKIMAMPDVVFAQGTADTPCTINCCQHKQQN